MTIARFTGTALLLVSFAACGDDAIGTTDTADTVQVLDTFVAPDTVDTFVPFPDTNPTDTGLTDSGAADTGVADSGPADTGPADTGPADTGLVDSGPADTGVADTGVADTGPADTGVADTGPADTGVADTGPADVGPQACPAPADETLVTTSTVFIGKNFSGAKDALHFNTDLCSDPPDSAERTYRFDLSSPTEVYAETDCGWDCELVLTKDGCDDAHVVDCETTLGDEIYAGTLAAGAYRMFIEGDNSDDPDSYDFMLNFNHTGGQAACVATAINAQNPSNCEDPIIGAPRYELTLTNQNLALADGDDFFTQDVGNCTHDDSHVGGAPDKVYSFTLSGEREVEITLKPSGWDATLSLTSAPCGATSKAVDCSDDLIGSNETISETLGAGTWYIIVDGFGEDTFAGDSHGPFELEVLVFDDACD